MTEAIIGFRGGGKTKNLNAFNLNKTAGSVVDFL
jgi:hypothetical protein